MNDPHARTNAKAAKANRLLGLAKLVGTSKQVAWAETIRHKFFRAVALSPDRVRTLSFALTDAATWISLELSGVGPELILKQLESWERAQGANARAGLPRLSVSGAELNRIEERRAELLALGAIFDPQDRQLIRLVGDVTDEATWIELCSMPLNYALAVLKSGAVVLAHQIERKMQRCTPRSDTHAVDHSPWPMDSTDQGEISPTALAAVQDGLLFKSHRKRREAECGRPLSPEEVCDLALRILKKAY